MGSFPCLATIQVPSPSKLFRSACCPDKDLVVLVSRLASQDRLALWNYSQGTKVWEVNLGGNEAEAIQAVSLAWSPDGQSIAVAHHPLQLTLHSVQDGSRLMNLPLGNTNNSIAGIWWFRDESSQPKRRVPDVFRTGDIITGSARSILRCLPRLDRFQSEASQVTATDLFAFQGSQTKASHKSVDLPEFIDRWPKFTSSPFLDDLYDNHSDRKISENDEVREDPIKNSLLLVSEKEGALHIFLDGSFPLGSVTLGGGSILSTSRHPKEPLLSVHPGTIVETTGAVNTSLFPVLIELPLLGDRRPRDLGELSTIARELVFYVLRVIKDMKSDWFGLESTTGARELGPKWVGALETRQRDQFGQQEPDAVLDLTVLLATGRATDSLLDFLGSGEHMSERGIQKWETTMVEVLVKLREFSEYRLIPACQRLYVVLEELKGWESLEQYAPFQLSGTDIENSLEMIRQLIISLASLSATVRKELDCFREFIRWLKFETLAANPSTESPPQPRHDPLEVNSYITYSLKANSIDQWFERTLPQNPTPTKQVISDSDGVYAALKQVRQALAVSSATLVADLKSSQVNHASNIEAMIQHIGFHCNNIFANAANAPCRSYTVASSHDITELQACLASPAQYIRFIRERTIDRMQYLAISLQTQESICLCLGRIQSSSDGNNTYRISVALIENSVPAREETAVFDLLDFDFFDDHCLIIVYRLRDEGVSFLGILEYDNVDYHPLPPDSQDNVRTREEFITAAMVYMEAGQIPLLRDAIRQSQELIGLKTGDVSLALNGRPGRRIACILDGQGTTLQSFDMEGVSIGMEDSEEEEPV